ncbi:MAG: CCA tRNA nucleotidyltransferase [Endomicrobiaceae bacterium]
MKNIIKTIQFISEKNNTAVFAVGGYIRDILLNKSSLDLDLVVSKSANIFAKKTAEALNGKYFLLHKDTQVYRVAVFGNPDIKYIDISLMHGKTIKDDLLNRDFTVNSLAVNIKNFNDIKNNVIDYCNGYADLKNKRINLVYGKAFSDDPLRMLRAFRIASEYNFKITENLFSSVKKYSKKINSAAPERIKNEFFRILNNKNSSKYISLMDDSKLLESIFPVIAIMKKSAKNFYYHPKGLFQHCFQTLESLEKILCKLDKYFPESEDKLRNHLNENFSDNVNKINLLKFTAIFHDCAKPECAKKIDKKIRFLGHEELGAEKASEIMKKLRMSNKEIDFVKSIIAQHMRPSNLAKSDIITNRAQTKLFRDLKENVPDVLILAMSDWHSYKSLKVYSKKILKQQEKAVAMIIKNYFEFITKTNLKKLIDGNDLMQSLSIKPGKIVGELLRAVDAAHQEGKINTKKEAIKLAKSKLTLIGKKHKI